MFAFAIASPNLPFAISLAIMLILSLLEGVGTLFGLGLSTLFETILPDIDIDFDIDGDMPDGGQLGGLSKLLGWLHFGKVPALILLVVFLTAFGLVGYGVQALANSIFGSLMPGSFASIIAFAMSLPVVRTCAAGLGKVLPKDETSAVSGETFVGRVAIITLGKAKKGFPAEARLKDQFGQTHYVMIEPDVGGEEFFQGDQILLVKKAGAIFKGIRNPNNNLVN